MAGKSLLWLRNDLRIADNPAMSASATSGGKVIALHVDEADPSLRSRGVASRWWLSDSLKSLAKSLAHIGIPLETREGAASAVIAATVAEHGIERVVWNRRYGPAEREIDAAIKASLKSQGIEAESFPGNVLVEPFDIATGDGQPFSVFTPFWNALRKREVPVTLAAPQAPGKPVKTGPVDTGYIVPDWALKLGKHWTIGETGAADRLSDFLENQIMHYPERRDFPALDATSKLSPHLAFGEISTRQVWHAALTLAHREPGKASAVEAFLRQLAWRDFNIHQLYHRPDIATVPMQAKFADLEWRKSAKDLRAWQRGETGFPLVDAGMRELWETGDMHNRVRMVAASFLSKNLLLDWRSGEEWFWDTLVDADAANNPGNWQWVAGSGLDAAPYFRIFNPLTQAKKFDPDGEYVQRWAPAPRDAIVDLKASRERALAAFKAI